MGSAGAVRSQPSNNSELETLTVSWVHRGVATLVFSSAPKKNTAASIISLNSASFSASLSMNWPHRESRMAAKQGKVYGCGNTIPEAASPTFSQTRSDVAMAPERNGSRKPKGNHLAFGVQDMGYSLNLSRKNPCPLLCKLLGPCQVSLMLGETGNPITKTLDE